MYHGKANSYQPKGGGYHYDGSAYIMTKIGKSFAEAMAELLE